MDLLGKRSDTMAAGPNTSKVALSIRGSDAGVDTAAQAGSHASPDKLILP